MRRFVLVCLLAAAARAQTAEELFGSRILPVLKRDCLGCHGEGQVLSKLDLRTRESMLAGGVRGAAVVPGDPEASPLYQVLTGRGPLRMPPVGKPAEGLADEISRWIRAGAPWRAEPAAGSWSYKDEDLWAFKPVRKEAGRGIDAFISAKLREKGLKPAPPAGKPALIRRVTFDLTGLPPTPEEVDAFLADRSPNAYAALVDRLLASPRYGERWARHWLDVVRYADSSGYSNDFERPNAWRYRDYVIRAFNQDKPFDRFVREQIAGDEIYPGDAEALIATGFLRAGPWEHTGMSVEAVTRQMFLDDVTNAVGVTFLGLTMGCARCHDHKFDPIPTRDYYRMQAVFASTEFARPRVPFLPAENTANLPAEAASLKRVLNAAQANMDRFDEISRQHILKKYNAARLEDIPKAVLEKAVRAKEGVGPAEFEEYKLYQKHVQLYRESLDRFEPKAFAVSSGPLDGETDGGPNLRYPKRAEYKPPAMNILVAGSVQSPGEPVEPGVPGAVGRYSALPEPEVPAGAAGRRAALAEWMADSRNPLTARVMVNRVWQYHFGRGLAADANNFGKMGAKPVYPELLDELAARFMRQGWKLKPLHREILLSDAYRRASAAPAESDPGNQYLSHFTPRRVEAEVLRDSTLAVAGELSPDAGGPGVFPQINEDVARQPLHRMGSLAPAYHPSPAKRDRNRRTVYAFQQRSLTDPMIDVFNGPNLDMSCERREASTLPTQAFALMNSQFMRDMSLAMAARVMGERTSDQGRLERAFRLVYGRPAAAEELKVSREHWDRMTARESAATPPGRPKPQPLVHTITSELTGENFRFVQQEDPAPFEHNLHPSEADARTRGLAHVLLALLNSNEFVYIY